MSKTKTKIAIAILLILTIILPISWLLFSDFVVNKPDFLRDVYLDKSSIEIVGDNNVAISFKLKNNSDKDYGARFLHICPVQDGQDGSYYIDYNLDFIGAGQTLDIWISTELSKERVEDIKVQVRDEENRSSYTSISESPSLSRMPKKTYYICWGVIIAACVLMFNKAIVLQLRNKDNANIKVEKKK